MAKVRRYLTELLRSLVYRIVEHIIIDTIVMSTLLTGFWQLMSDDWRYFLTYTRTLVDGFYSGYVHGTPFRTSGGQWAVSWQLGGEPFIHVIIPLISRFVFLFSTILLTLYLTRKYLRFRRFVNVCTIPRHPKSFRNCISVVIITSTLVTSLLGFAGTVIDPNIFAPANSSKNCIDFDVHVSLNLQLTVTRYARVEFDPSTLEKSGMDSWLYCYIKTSEIAYWTASDIDLSSIVLNASISPSDTFLCCDRNGTELALARFDMNLFTSVFNNQTFMANDIATYRVEGRLKNGDFFAGDGQVQLICSHS